MFCLQFFLHFLFVHGKMNTSSTNVDVMSPKLLRAASPLIACLNWWSVSPGSCILAKVYVGLGVCFFSSRTIRYTILLHLQLSRPTVVYEDICFQTVFWLLRPSSDNTLHPPLFVFRSFFRSLHKWSRDSAHLHLLSTP